MSKTLPKWTDDREATLVGIVGDETPVSVETVAAAAESLETSTRSVAAKLRKMDYEVESTAKAAGKSYTEEEEVEIENFLNSHPNEFTYAEVATKVLGGSRTAKQIQGKILSMDLYGLVKPTPKQERAKTYSDDEEETLLKLVRAGGFIEDIAEAMGRPVNSIRGKILSLSRVYDDITIPKQKEYKAKKEDAFTALGDVSEMTVEEIAEAIEKTPRGVKTILTHRGKDCANYKGSKKKAANDEKRAAV